MLNCLTRRSVFPGDRVIPRGRITSKQKIVAPPQEIDDAQSARNDREAGSDAAPPSARTNNAEHLLPLLINQITDYAIFLLDTNGCVATWNPGAQRIKGYRADEIIGHHFSRFYPEEAKRAKWPEYELKMAVHEGRFEDEGWRIRKDGSRFWANVVITPVRDAAGRLSGFAKITRDLTERRKQEETLRQSEHFSRLLIEGVKDSAIVSLSPLGAIQTWNAGAQRIYGYPASEIIGAGNERFFRPEDLERGAPSKELEAARSAARESEGWRIRKDGSRFWASVTTTPILSQDDALMGYVQVVRDMTESRRIEALEEAGRRTNEFIAMLAHELRNPLAPIRNALAVMQTGGSVPPSLEPWISVIDRQASLLSRLVDDLLDASRVASGKITVQRELCNLTDILARALEAGRPFIEARGHRLEVQLPTEALTLNGDAVRLCQVFVNLLDNAAKFTPRGGLVRVTVERDGEDAVVRVQDNGIGMAAELRERAFDLFVQGERQLDRAGGGLGVGLPLARQIVELHGGTVRASSPGPNQGTEITVCLPLLTAAHLDADTAQSTQAAGEATLSIMVVDDNQDSAETLSMLLQLWGHQVCTAHGGDEALRLARQNRPALVILDIGLPGIDGYEVARRLRRMASMRNARLIALTGYSQPDDRMRSIAAGFDEHLVKPVNGEQLRRSLHEAARLLHRDGDGRALRRLPCAPGAKTRRTRTRSQAAALRNAQSR